MEKDSDCVSYNNIKRTSTGKKIFDILKHEYIIVYDSECVVCDSWIKFLFKNDTKKVFGYTSIKGKFIEEFTLEQELLDIIDTQSSIVLLHFKDGNVAYKSKSECILEIIGMSDITGKGVISLFGYVPQCIRDFGYNIFSSNRQMISSMISESEDSPDLLHCIYE